MIDSRTLNGWSYRKAKCFGMPHHGAKYTGGDVRRYERDPEALCMVCGRPATETHHEPNGRNYFTLRTSWGTFVLKPALIALCRDCHEKRTRNELSILWEWNTEQDEAAWWSGHLLAHGLSAHSPLLYALGGWHVEKQG